MSKKILVDVRDAFFDGVFDFTKKNKNVFFITSDHTAYSLEKFKKKYSNSFINAGISEQNIASLAAGMALENQIVFIYGITPFICFRNFEQINIDICSMNLNVNIISMGSGLSYSSDGPTHHGIQDQSIMSCLPNLRIFNVSDPLNAYKFPFFASKYKGPKLFRIEKGKLSNIYNKKENFIKGIGYIKKGKKTLIVSTGYMSQKILNLINDFDSKDEIGFLDIYRIKPLNKIAIIRVLNDYRSVIVIEENIDTNSLGSQIAEIIAINKLKNKLLKMNLGDKYLFNSGPREWMHEINGLGKNKIINIIKKESK